MKRMIEGGHERIYEKQVSGMKIGKGLLIKWKEEEKIDYRLSACRTKVSKGPARSYDKKSPN